MNFEYETFTNQMNLFVSTNIAMPLPRGH